MSVQEPSSFRLIGTLALVGLASGLVLVTMYLITRPVILDNQAAALERAIFAVLPEAESFEALRVDGDELVPYTGAAAKAPTGEVVYAATDAQGRQVGYAVPAEGSGFQDTIKLLYGFKPGERVIVGFEVLESRETPGLGDKIITDQDFVADFERLEVEPKIEAITRGEGTEPNQVDCITGATISSKAVVAIMNDSMDEWLPILTEEAPVGGQG